MSTETSTETATETATETPAETRDQDVQQLELLAVFHHVVAAVVALFSSLFLFHFGFGLMMLLPGGFGGHDAPPIFVGWFMMILGAMAVLSGWSFAALLVMAGRNLQRQRRHTFCLVVAGLACAFMPLGTVLGVFTILVLQRPSVKARFAVT